MSSKVAVPAPAHTERVPSALRATSSMVPAGWTWRQPEPGARPEVDGLDPVGGEARQPVARGAGPVEGVAEPGDDPAQDRRRGRHRRVVEGRHVRARSSGSTEGSGVVGGRGRGRPRSRWPGRARPRRPRRSRWPPPRRSAANPALTVPVDRLKLTTATRRSRRTPLVVVVLLAKRTSAWLTSSTMTTHALGAARGQGPLDHLLGRGQTPLGLTLRPSLRVTGRRRHRDDSARALRTLTARNSAEGQPWLTGATWPGWPLPQLKAPPST